MMGSKLGREVVYTHSRLKELLWAGRSIAIGVKLIIGFRLSHTGRR